MGMADGGVEMDTARAAQVWQSALAQLRVRVSREGFETWLAPTRGRKLAGSTIEVEVPNAFSADWISQHYATEIRTVLAATTGQELDVAFRPGDSTEVVIARREPATRPATRGDGYRLQSKYTFETFVVGEQNRLAAAASRSVAERPATSYNPLFIYGGVGLGKTHLIQAIGNLALKLRPALRVYYTAAENLFIELIQAIERNTRLEFKNKYRGLDLLLLDDIHYLIGKERLQEEVFYIFNNLHDAGSQIVFTSDRPPGDIPTLESRLASRLGSGLVVDIQPPDVETRVAILQRKAALDNLKLPDDVALYVASRARSSIRELEGCLTRLLAINSLQGEPLTVEAAAAALKDLTREEQPLDPKQILAACADAFGVPVPDMTGQSRTKQIVLARQTAMYLMRTKLNLSLNEVGFHFGDRDHTTVMHAVGKVTELQARDATFSSRLAKLTKGISRGEGS
jgi:chromosomal replication initiator protein